MDNFSLKRAHKPKKTVAQYFLTMTGKAIIKQLYCNTYFRPVILQMGKRRLYGH